MKKNFTIYRSSAGSGKTYALVRNYITMALLGDEHGFRPRYFRHILAITFTNKAASEMKGRVLQFLSDLAEGKGADKEDTFFTHIQEDTHLNVAEVQARAQLVLSAVLHQYADLSISTIDKFVYRIVRTFAHDLELAQSFEVEMDQSKMIQPVVALLISKVGTNKDLSKALVAFALSKAEEGKSYNLEQDLEKFAKHLFVEESEPHIQSLKSVGINDCLEVKNQLQKEIAVFEQPLLDYAQQFSDFLHRENLEPNNFYHSDFYNYFDKLIALDTGKMFPGKRLKESMDANRWYAKSCPLAAQETIDSNEPFLRGLYENTQKHIGQHFKEYVFNKLLSRNIYSIAVLNELLQELESYKSDNNIKHISEFNKAISEIIRKEPAPFIYERLGERYKHFLVDEFQDTSVMQWHNLLPLVHHSLSMGNQNLIVGDAKQSIYRWRGGEVEQFVKLPTTIFKEEGLPNPAEVSAALQRNAEEVLLKDNWRSNYEVVDFNNRFFSSLKGILTPELQEIYQNHEQNPRGDKGGVVHIDFTVKSDEVKAKIMQKVICKAKELNALQYDWKEMAVLCRTRKDASEVAFHLNQAGLKVVSDEALLLNTSSEVNVLIAVLSYLHDDSNKVAMTNVLHFLFQKGLLKGDLHTQLKSVSTGNKKDFLSVLSSAGIAFSPQRLWQLPLYDLVEKLIKQFQLSPSNIYLQFFLDAVLKFSVKRGNDVVEFLEWWEENNEKEAIVVPDDMDAIKVMTVHKSKGLEFPIVFLPFNWEIGKPKSELWVDAKGKIQQMKVALLSNSKLLDDSEYADLRQEELNKALLDDLNVLYVAMTRPKHQLYIYTEESSGGEKYNALSKLMDYYFKDQEVQFPYQEGELFPKKQDDKDDEPNDGYYLDYSPTENWRSVVQLKNSAQQLWDVELDKKEWGTLLHQALSKIHYLSDKDKVLESLKQDGLMNDSLKEKLKIRIEELLQEKSIQAFFSEDWEVKTEQEILQPDGDTYVPDRILFKDGLVQIVDYKTGSTAQQKKHENQIKNYAHLLQQMGYSNIQKFLIYTEEKDKVKKV